jgi:isochorismate synthase
MTQSTGRVTPLTGSQLVSAYARGDFFFANERHTILGQGVFAALTEPDPLRLAESVAEALSDSVVPMAVGALPFSTGSGTRTPGHMVIPWVLHRAGPILESLPREVLRRPTAVRPVPSPERHLVAVAEAVAALRDRRMRKVVLARALDLDFTDAVRPEQIVRNLAQDNPRDYTFAAALPNARTIVGATPELLISRVGTQVIAHPHAGSMPRSADLIVDRANGQALLASEKDHIEHAAVTEALVESLRPFCRALTVPSEPELVSTAAVWHLRTTITGELIDRDITALTLAAALHPTPAICGTPTDAARSLVGELEPFDRAYYAGTVGWVDADGDGEWVVAIRCAEVADTSMRLYAGGGIVPASDPRAELDETSAKFQILLRAMGLDLSL